MVPFWEKGGFFKADANSKKPAYCISSLRRMSPVFCIWGMPLSIPCKTF